MLEMYLVHKHDLEIRNKSIWNLWAIHASKVKLYLVQNSFILLLSCNKWIHDIFGLGQNINRDTQSPLSVTIKASRLEFSQFWLHCWTWISECDLPLLGKYTSLKAVMSISVGCMDFWKSCLQIFLLQLLKCLFQTVAQCAWISKCDLPLGKFFFPKETSLQPVISVSDSCAVLGVVMTSHKIRIVIFGAFWQRLICLTAFPHSSHKNFGVKFQIA